MKETRKGRISRLQTRKQELLGQMKKLGGNASIRNVEFKIDRLNAQVLTITEKIIELRIE